MFQTNYMPLKIFSCRCRTEVDSKIPCDEKLATEIGPLARSWVSSFLIMSFRIGKMSKI